MSANTSLIWDDLDGQLLLPDDRGYDDARHVWNAMVDRRPRMIIRCASVADVIAAVRTARELDLEIGVRCGGHSVLGLAVPEDGMMLDLTLLSHVRVDAERRRARVGGGALLGALDVAAQRHGLATTAGNVSHTGVAGLTLGGGMGWLARQHGLACDNVISFEMVTADGEVVRANEQENPELFWGLRGGGGNFGIVTEFEFRLHPVGTRALSVELDFSAERAAGPLAAWRDLSTTAPRRATFTATVAGGIATVGFVWVGDPADGRRFGSRLQAEVGRPSAERIVELSYVDLQRRHDDIEGHGSRRYWKGHYFRELRDETLDALLRHAPAVGATLQAFGGAIADMSGEATAFSHRDAAFQYDAAARWTDPTEDDEQMRVARECATRLEPFASGAYVNVLSDEGPAGMTRAYSPEKLSRLRALKNDYDPENLFHLNQNIRPDG